MTAGAERRLAIRARELMASGPDALEELPDRDRLAGGPEEARHQVLQGLRLELHAISSIVADATVARTLAERRSYPPYGLLRSMHSDSRMLVTSPDAVEEGSLDGFLALGKALVDTTVFHLDRQFREYRQSDRSWLIERLEALLALFRIGAGPLGKSRMRDGLSFVYGGLHFGTGVCVQLAEVMSRLLAARPATTVDERAAVMARSIRPAYRLAALNIDHVIFAYQDLQEPTQGRSAPPQGPSWMDAERFSVQHAEEGRPWRIDLRDDQPLGGTRQGRPLEDIGTTYATLGCPARTSPTGGSSAIAALWSWCVELAQELGLLEAVDASPG
ncbi:MAG: hypothetical protein M3378_12825 [Actinomycetota bacterium]|nr:hypothetical protein [Actinomycetota bacterium]